MLKGFRMLKRFAMAAAAALVLLAAGPVYAASLNPYYVTSNKTFYFDSAPSGQATMVCSTVKTFATYVSSDTAVAVSTVCPSPCNTQTCYFEVKDSAADDSYYETFSTAYYAAPGTPTFPWVQPTLMLVNWSVDTNPYMAQYELNVAVDSAFTEPLASSTTYRYDGSVIVSPLSPNTTYYARVRAMNADKTYTAFSATTSIETLPSTTTVLSVDVSSFNITAVYTPLPLTPLSASCSGYALKVGDKEDFSGVNYSSTTTEVLVDTLEVKDLPANTTYYYALGPKNSSGAISFNLAEVFVTKPVQLTGFSISQLHYSSTAFTWAALPASPQAATSEGYRVDVSLTSDFSTVISSSTASVAQSTLAPQGLLANTAYYARAGAVNWAGDVGYNPSSANISFRTLALPLDLNLMSSSSNGNSITLNWAHLEPSPQSVSCAGYIAQASVNADFSSGVYFSSTTSNAAGSLTIYGLYPNQTYFVRVGTYNQDGEPNYVYPPKVKTTDGAALTNVVVASTGTTWINFSWDTDPVLISLTNGYVAHASTSALFVPVFSTAISSNKSTTSLVLDGLIANSTYFVRVGVRYGDLADETTIYSTPVGIVKMSTLAQPFDSVSVSGIFQSSVAVGWTARPASPSSSTAEGYLVRVSTASDMSGAVFSSSTLRVGVTSLVAASLTPNTRYYARAGTYNWDYVPNETALAAFVTRANSPTPQAISDVDNQQIRFNWLANSNPDGTVYNCEISTSSGFEILVVPAADTVGKTMLYSGLNSNTTFYFRIKSRNSAGVEESPLVFPAAATLAIPPVAKDYSNVQAYGFQANWDPGLNGPGTVYQVQVSTDGLYNTLSATGQATTGYYVFSALVGNMTYYGRVRSVSASGSYTAWANLGAVLTMPATPVDGNPIFSNIVLDSFTAAWGANGNSGPTVYQVEISSFSDYSRIASSASVNALTYAFTDLSQETSYYTRVRAAPNASLLNPSYHSLGIAFTPRYGRGDISYSNGGIALLPATYGTIKVSGPAQSFKGSVTITIERNFNMPSGSSMATPMLPTGVGVNVTAVPHFQPDKTLTLVIPYRLQDMTGFDRSRLIIAYYNTDGDAWVPLPSVSDTANNLVTAQITHLSIFQIMQANPAQGVGSIKIFPNPFRPSRHSFMQFANMPSGARVRLFTLLGELVTEFTADYSGNAIWDGKNKYGSKVASGVFIVLIEGDGVGKHVTKLAVER